MFCFLTIFQIVFYYPKQKRKNKKKTGKYDRQIKTKKKCIH